MLIHLHDRIYYTSPAKQSYGACFISLPLTLNLFFVGAQLAALLSTSRAPSVQCFLPAFPFLISLTISNGFLMSALNLECRGLGAPSVSPECFREGMTDHPLLYSCQREELVSRVGNAFISLFFVLECGWWSIPMCVLSFLPIGSNCWFSFFASQIVEHSIACMQMAGELEPDVLKVLFNPNRSMLRKSLPTCIYLFSCK